jgi:hypothetical protein
MAGIVAENTGVAEDDVRLGESATAIAAGASSKSSKQFTSGTKTMHFSRTFRRLQLKQSYGKR